MSSSRLVTSEEFKVALCAAVRAAGLPLRMGWPLEARLIVKSAGSGWSGDFTSTEPEEIKLELEKRGEENAV